MRIGGHVGIAGCEGHHSLKLTNDEEAEEYSHPAGLLLLLRFHPRVHRQDGLWGGSWSQRRCFGNSGGSVVSRVISGERLERVVQPTARGSEGQRGSVF